MPSPYLLLILCSRPALFLIQLSFSFTADCKGCRDSLLMTPSHATQKGNDDHLVEELRKENEEVKDRLAKLQNEFAL